MNEELTTLIVSELVKHHDRKEIIRKVCEQSGLNWREAEQLLVLVEAQNRRTIAARQSPLLFLLSVGTLLLGLGLMAFNIEILFAFLQQDLLGQILGLQSGYYRVIGLVTGFGMTSGGLIGLWKGLLSIFPE